MKSTKLSLTKRLLVVFSVLFIAVGTIFMIRPTDKAQAEEIPALEILTYTLNYSEKVQVVCAVKTTGIDRGISPVMLSVEKETYEKNSSGVYVPSETNETYSLLQGENTATVKGETCEIFYLNGVSSKNLIDNLYITATAEVNGEKVVSSTECFNVIGYLQAQLRKSTLSEKQRSLYSSLLSYANASQVYFNYRTDKLATTDYYKVTLNNGTLEDGYSTGYFTLNQTAVITANPAPEGYVFSHWEKGGESIGTNRKLEITVSGDSEYTAVYIVDSGVEYALSYNLGGGTNNLDNPEKYTGSTETFTLQAPSKSGYYFTGWTGEGLSTPTMIVTIERGSMGDKSYTANWEVLDSAIQEIPQASGTVYIDNNYFIDYKANSVETSLYVTDVNDRKGIVTLYNDIETLNYLHSAETYYLFATEGNTAKFYLVFSGNEYIEIASKAINNSIGKHTYKVSISGENKNVVKCYFDGAEVISVDMSTTKEGNIFHHGRVGIYSPDNVYEATTFANDNVSGVLELSNMKDYLYEKLQSIPAVTYEFDDLYKDGVGVPYLSHRYDYEEHNNTVKIMDIPTMVVRFETFKNGIYDGQSIKDVMSVIVGEKDILFDAIKEYTVYNLKTYAKRVYDAVVMPYISTTSVVAVERGNAIMYADPFSNVDTRAYMPNAYMLYSGIYDGDTRLRGVLDILGGVKKIEGASFFYVYKFTDWFVEDILRAVAYYGYEYYYWQEYAKNNTSVLDIWHSIYSYSAAASANSFEYIGEVLHTDTDGDGNPEKYYTWTKDYRLNDSLFNPNLEDSEERTGDPQKIINTFINLVSNYIKNSSFTGQDYTVYLNTNGGTLTNGNVITHNSQTNLTLPTPTREGYTFLGWYESPAFEEGATAYSQVSATAVPENRTFYAKWALGCQSVTENVIPAVTFGENMILQQNKPINIFGTGVDGKIVSVTFNNQTLQTTVENGEWSVTFDGLVGSFNKYQILISSDGVSYIFGDVMVGEVWLASGQSNMEYLVNNTPLYGQSLLAEYSSLGNYDKIRMFRQSVKSKGASGVTGELLYAQDNANKWDIINNIYDAYPQSAYALSFALNLQDQLGVPVGMIVSAVGGTAIEEWLSEENNNMLGTKITDADADLQYDGLSSYEDIKSRYYNGMTKLLGGITVSGVIWYQGENNYLIKDQTAIEHYQSQLVALHGQYKTLFNDANIPLIVTEVAPFESQGNIIPRGTAIANFRIIQRQTVNANDNMYLVSTVDIGERYDIHPAYKFELGRRTALTAVNLVYGENAQNLKTLHYEGTSFEVGNGTITITFNGKLVQKGELIGFAVWDGEKLNKVTARIISDNQVTLYYSGTIKVVYYMYYNYLGIPGLYGDNGLPILPFYLQ